MSNACFDIPEDREETYPCPKEFCSGSVTKLLNDLGEVRGWECDTCDWVWRRDVL